jgi:putative ABC transport system permease protein
MSDWKAAIRQRLASLKLAPVRESEIVEELAQHLDDRYHESLRGGSTESEARSAALLELSEGRLLARGLSRVEHQVALEPVILGSGRRNIVLDLWQDIKYGVRMLLGHPGFTLVATLTLALGIGGATAIFSLVDGILLKPLPYRDPGRLIFLIQSFRQKGLDSWGLSPANFASYHDQSQSFESLAGYANQTGVNLSQEGRDSEHLEVTRVTSDFFRVLGAQPALGRDFHPGEDTAGNNSVCILSYGLWQRRFGGDASIVGQTLALDGISTEVVGVMPAGFKFPTAGTELWIPLGLQPQRRAPFMIRGIGRLKPGLQPSEAEAETTVIFKNTMAQWPDPPPEGADLKTLVTPLKDSITGKAEKPLLVLLFATGLVLLIACANVANLLLARSTSRVREIAIRFALGASPGRVVRQLLTENVLLAFGGAAAGIGLAWWGSQSLSRLPIKGIPRIDEVSLNLSVVGFAIASALVTGLLFGLAPAMRAYRSGMNAGLREGQKSSAGASSRRANSVLVSAQLALSLMLLIGAGLLLKSFQRLKSVDPGFQPENVLTVRISVPRLKYPSPAQLVRFRDSALAAVRGLPGIKAAAMNAYLPFAGGGETDGYIVEGQEPSAGSLAPQSQAWHGYVEAGYFEAMGIPLRQGREFQEADREGAPLVAIVDETLARLHWPGGSALGKRIETTGDREWMEIVGVVGAVKDLNLAQTPEPHIYFPHAQNFGQNSSMYLIARTTGDPAGAAPSIRKAIQSLDPDLPLYSVRPMTEIIGDTVGSQRLTNLLLCAFAAIALLLAAVGVYGVMSVYVSNRTNEFGIRLALGQGPHSLLLSIMRQGLLLALAGIAAGIAGALALTQVIASLLFEVSATDPIIFTSIPLLLTAVALAACLIPARRASRVDPMVALRYE